MSNSLQEKIKRERAELSRKWHGVDARKKPTVILLGSIILLVIVLLIVGGIPRIARLLDFNRKAAITQKELPGVHVQKARVSNKAALFKLPGDVQAWEEATIYARVDGFLKHWSADIGDRVHKGQLLAEIESPDMDQQLAQAAHTLDQARATELKDKSSMSYNKLTMDRWINLRDQGAVSRQDADTDINQYKNSQHQVDADAESIRSNQANVERLKALKGFERVIAPFDGVVTSRRVNTGDLISSGSSSSTTNMFKVARIDTVRVFVEVPQTYVDAIHNGSTAEVTVQALGRRKFEGKIARNANELDANARTLLCEVDIDNKDGALLPGMYAQVQLSTYQSHPTVLIPATALVIRPNENQVAIITADNRIHWQTVEIGRDYGNEIEIVVGLKGGESLVVNPTDQDTENRKVTVLPK
jgi:RND family efflux transporter MFP subunit